MARSARRPEPEETSWTSPLGAGAATLVEFVFRQPVLVGGATAFMVALSFVSANAIWYQPYAHPGAFFATRDMADGSFRARPVPTTRFDIERPAVRPARPVGDAQVEEVQSILRNLNFYTGEVDGLFGPNTRKAIETYQAKIGMAVTGTVDEALLVQLGASPKTSGILPSPAPREAIVQTASTGTQASREPDRTLMRIQAGLRAFGNESIEIDGYMGAQTRAAIEEFQSLFGLPRTGEPDASVYAKMREIGLTD